MANFYYRSLGSFLLFLIVFSGVYGQAPGCPNVDAGEDQLIACGGTVDLSADFLETGETSEYTVTPIDYAPPFPFTGGSGSTSITADDRWSQIIDLGFDFCFFDGQYSSVLINSNGAITFDVAGRIPGGRYNANTGAAWSIGGSIPGSGDARTFLSIFGVLQDTDPAISGAPYSPSNPNGWTINYELVGDFPCRMLVFNIYNLKLFSNSRCPDINSTYSQSYQIVLYETTNVIDVYVKSRVACTGWNNGRGIIGIQNRDATVAFTPPGRNTGTWNATEEAWRFTPSGPSNSQVSWLDADGNFIGSGRDITVTPPYFPYTYTAQAEYFSCNGEIVTVDDTVTIDIDPDFSVDVDLGDDYSECGGEPQLLDADPNNDPALNGATYQWYWDGNIIPGATSSTYLVNPPDSGTYSVQIEAGECSFSASIEIEFKPQPEIADEPEDLRACADAGSSAEFDLTVNGPIVLGTQDPSFNISYHLSQNDAQNGTGAIPNPAAYNFSGTTAVIWVRIQDASGDCYEITSFNITLEPGLDIDLGEDYSECGGEPVTLNADPGVSGATYQWFLNGNPIPGATSSTYTVSPPDSGVYSVEVEAGECEGSDSIQITFKDQPEIAEQPEDLYLCSQGSNSGIFDLTVNTPRVLGGQDPSFSASYHTSQQDAQNGSNPIATPDAYPFNGTSQTIWVRVENGDGDCHAIASFEISFASAVATPPSRPHVVCDQDGDGEEMVDLEAVFTLDILNGQNPIRYTVTYHETQADAEAGINAVPNLFLVTTSPVTLYARVEYGTNSGCYDTTSLQIIMENPPVVNYNPLPLISCDSNNDGYTSFNLHDADADISMGDPDLIITYHPTLLDAQNNLNELPTPYRNDDPWNDVVFVRIKSADSDCYATVRLELIVRMSPELTEPTPYYKCDDDDDGIVRFNLRLKEPEMLGSLPADHYDFYYYEEESAAITAGNNALHNPDFSEAIPNPTAYFNLINPQTIYVLAVGNANNTTPHNGGTGCYDIVPLELIVIPSPVAVQPLPYELCDDEESGSTTDQRSYFDLTSRNNIITGGVSGVTVTWYETYADITAGTPIATPEHYLNRAIPPAPANPQTVIALVENIFGCSDTVTLTLVVNPLPDARTPDPLELCDIHDNGIAEFDLTQRDIDITHGEPDLIVDYYTTRALAEAGDPATAIQNGLYTNTRSPYNDTVYARVTYDSTGCYVVVALDLIVNPLPDRPLAGFGDLRSCDMEGNDTAIFNLTLNTPFILGNQNPSDFTISYHISEEDAQNAADAIANANHYESSGQTIWVRIENNDTGCFRILSFNLIVGARPAIMDPEPMALCDDEESGSMYDGISIFNLTQNNFFITGGNGTLRVVYYETEADRQNDTPIANPRAYANPTDADGHGISPYTIYVAVFDATGCPAYTTLELIVNPVPRVEPPTPLVVCDDDNEGYAYFDLTTKDEEISGGDPTLTVTYHETELDAENGRFPLASPYQNIVAGRQIIYVRATYTATGCFVVVPLELLAAPTPVVPHELPDLIACDLEGNGHATFNLMDQAPLIYGTQDPTSFDLTFHLTQDDAEAGTNPIVTPEEYINTTNPQTIYYRLGFPTGERCYATGHFELIVAPQVPANQEVTPYEVCTAVGSPNAMQATFDLTTKIAEITGGAAGVGVSFFTTREDAENNTNRIDPDWEYTNTSNPQRIWVRVMDGNTQCVAYTSFTLRVLPNPEPVTPDPIETCDPDNEGEVEFDLTIRTTQILNGENWRLTYFESYEDALEDTNAIPDPEHYTNQSNPQTIYIRVTNDTSGCFEIVELQLIVHDVPDETADISPYMICELDTDALALFDLTTKIPEILGTLDPEAYEVSFYLEQADAEAGINAIVEPHRHFNRDRSGNIVNPQTIYVGILIPGSECYMGGVMSFELIVQEGAVATAPAEPFTICDNLGPNDGIAQFNLEDFSKQKVVDFRNEILAGQNPAGYSLHFYESYDNALSATDTIVWPYVNVINPQIIYARVTNEDNLYEPKCFDIVEVILNVEELPELIFEDEFRLCVDAEGNPIREEFGAMSPPVIDTFLDPAVYSFEWLLDDVIVPGEEGPALTVTSGGVYTVIATHRETGCVTVGTATVTISSPPVNATAQVTSEAFSDLHTIEVSTQGEGVYEYQLDNGSFQDSPIFNNVTPGNHTVTIRDKNGCGSVTIPVGVIDYPLFFTPNGDGYNDTWNIIGMVHLDPEAKIYIFDRFGKLLTQISPAGPGWDGTYNGNKMPSSDYWFRVEYIERDVRKEMRGHFSLKR